LQTALSYKLIKKIKDEKFDEDELHTYTLLIHLGIRDAQVAVLAAEQRLLWFEDYVFGDISSHAQHQQAVQDLFDAHPLLMAGFWKTVIFSLKSNKFVQVPQALFIPEAAFEYLSLNAQVDARHEAALFMPSARSSAVTVFAIQKELHAFVQARYSRTTLVLSHQAAALIEGVLDAAASEPNCPLFIYVDRFKLHILSVQNGQLVYYNQFVIKQFADYVKYIMLVLKTLELDQQTSRITLWGYIGKNSPHYHEFVKYIRNVQFGKRPAHIKFGYVFDEIQEHHFFDLYALPLLA